MPANTILLGCIADDMTGADVLLVGSPKVATLLARACPRDERPALVAIGPTTARAARYASGYLSSWTS